MVSIFQKVKTRTFSGVFGFILVSFFVIVASASAISQGYMTSDKSIKPGVVVSLKSDGNEPDPYVEKATEDNIGKIIGVATTVGGSTITLGSSDQNVFVESGGSVKAYVSDINGPVRQGDQLTISALSGIMGLSDKNSKIILGVALENFPATGAQAYEIESSEGAKSVNIAQISVNLDSKSKVDSSNVDSSLERFGKSVSGKEVSEVRVVIALVVFLLVLIVEGGILYGSFSSAIGSLGRNPLAEKIIKKQLIQVVFVALSVLILGLVAIYLILWL